MKSTCCENPVKRVAVISVAVMCLILILMLASCAGDSAADDTGRIVGGDKIRVTRTLSDRLLDTYKDSEVYLVELRPGDYNKYTQVSSPLAVTDSEVIDSAHISGRLNFDFPLYDGERTRLYSAFLLAVKSAGGYTALTHPVLIENPETGAENADDYPHYASVKGLRTTMYSDAVSLGTAHSVIDVMLDRLMLPEYKPYATEYVFDGITYYIDTDELTKLDTSVRICTDNGIEVFLQLLLSPDGIKTLPELYYPGASEKAQYCAIYTDSREGMRHVEGFLDFLASRYTKKDAKYGFAASYIIGRNVDNALLYNNTGTAYGNGDFTKYVGDYSNILRMAYNALASHYSGGRVYAAVSSNWSDINETDKPVWTANSLLNMLNTSSPDFPWNVASAMYQNNKNEANVWTEHKEDDQTLTVRNLGRLTEKMTSDDFKYKGTVRHIIISECGVSGADETMQYCAYAYIYYTVLSNGHIDALIWSDQVDNRAAEAHMGMWTVNADGSANKARLLRQLYGDIDRNLSAYKDTVYAKLGNTWAGLYNNNYAAADVSEYVKGTTATAAKKAEIKYDFGQDSLCGFIPSFGAVYTELGLSGNDIPVLRAKLLCADSEDSCGVSRPGITGAELSGADSLCIGVRTLIAGKAVDSCRYTLRLTRSSNETTKEGADNRISLVYEAAADGQTNQKDLTNLTFDLSGLDGMYGKDDMFTLSVLVSSPSLKDGGTAVMELGRISVSGGATSAGGSGGFLAALVTVLILTVVLALFVVLIIKRVRKTSGSKRTVYNDGRDDD